MKQGIIFSFAHSPNPSSFVGHSSRVVATRVAHGSSEVSGDNPCQLSTIQNASMISGARLAIRIVSATQPRSNLKARQAQTPDNACANAKWELFQIRR